MRPGDNIDPNKLGSWERPSHNSSKITRQNLDDAKAVDNAFNGSIDSGNSLWAPEGNNKDYFLKAKDNIVGQQNDRKIGEFLNQFHGMDFFKRGVPEMEKGLKGTGYDMGPSANIVDNLKEAVDEGDTKEVENIIEEHPEESQEILPEDTPIQEEAEQITEDDKPQNDEVNNEVVEDFVKEPSAESELRTTEPDNTPLESDTDKTNDEVVDKKNPGSSFMNIPEDTEPLPLVSGYRREGDKLIDEFGNEIPDYEPIDTEGGVLAERDEDFAGPDEYVDEATGEIKSLEDRQFPALNQQDYHKDLALNGDRDLESTETDELDYTVEGESDFEPTVYKIEDLDREIKEVEQWPVTNVEEAKAKQNKLKGLRSRRIGLMGSGHAVTPLNVPNENKTILGGGPRAGIGNVSMGGGSSGHGSMSPVNSRRANSDISRALTGGGAMPVTLNPDSSKVIQPSRSFSNGSLSSGSFGLMSKNKGNGAFSSKPVSLPNGESSSVVEGLNVDSIADSGKNALVERLKTLLDKLSPEQRKQLGFSPKGYIYQGERLEDLDGYTIQKLLEDVSNRIGE
jgi:hypothetical protein